MYGNVLRFRILISALCNMSLAMKINVKNMTTAKTFDSVSGFLNIDVAYTATRIRISERYIMKGISAEVSVSKGIKNVEMDEYSLSDYAEWGEAFGEIIKDGQVVGYIVPVEYYIDDSLFDGGGVTMFFDIQGRLVVAVEWWG